MAAGLAGKWRLESTEGFDAYMKEVGVGFVMRNLAATIVPDQHISVAGDTWTIQTKSTIKNTEVNFKLGETFDETTADGRKVKTTCSVDGTQLIQHQTSTPPSTIIRNLENEQKMVLTCEANSVKATRVYKRLE